MIIDCTLSLKKTLLPANAGDMGLIPCSRRSHMPWGNQACEPQLLSLHVTTPEAHIPRSHAPQQVMPPATRMRSLHTATRNTLAQQRRPSTAKSKIIYMQSIS